MTKKSQLMSRKPIKKPINVVIVIEDNKVIITTSTGRHILQS